MGSARRVRDLPVGTASVLRGAVLGPSVAIGSNLFVFRNFLESKEEALYLLKNKLFCADQAAPSENGPPFGRL